APLDCSSAREGRTARAFKRPRREHLIPRSVSNSWTPAGMPPPTSLHAAECRKRAADLRERAAKAEQEVVRRHLLETAAIWDRIADDEEKAPKGPHTQ